MAHLNNNVPGASCLPPLFTTSYSGRESKVDHCKIRNQDTIAAVVLTQISAYIMHKNLAVRKIMEVMRTVYAKNGTWSQHVSNKTWRKRSRNIICEYVKGKCTIISLNRLMNLVLSDTGAFEMHHSFIYFFSLVCKFLVDLHTLYASP